MVRLNTLLRVATAVALSTSMSAAAMDGPHVVGTGENASVEYDRPSENVVGGALTRQVGSGEGASTEVVAVARTNPGRLSRVVGSGEGAETVFLETAPTVMFTGSRQAR